MKKALLIFVCLSFTILAAPHVSPAFEAFECGDQQITVWGFIRNNLGMFEHTQEFTYSGNQLATARTWLRTYLDWKINEQFKFYTAVQFVWEPWYKVEEGNPTSENGGSQQHRKPGWKTYSEFDDVNDVIREVYVEWKPDKRNTFKIGRQIAIWGEAIANAPLDVVHPTDTRFSFFFVNAEDNRIPQYMVRALHDIPSLNSSFEWIVMPLLLEAKYSVNRSSHYSNMQGSYEPEERFTFHPEDRTDSYYTAFSNLMNVLSGSKTELALLRYDPSIISHDSFIPSAAFRLGDIREKYPDNFSDTRFGARTSTLLGGYQFGFAYFHTHLYTPLSQWGAVRLNLGPYMPLVRDMDLVHPTYDVIGFYMNKQLPWPGVIRSEVAYSPNLPYNTFSISSNENGIVRRDNLKYMIAYDLSSYFYFDWHKTAAFDISFEHQGEWTPNASDLQYAVYYTKVPTYHASFGVTISTNWLYNKFSTMVTASYDTFGNSGFIMPVVKWMPGWMNSKFSAELRYIGIFGDSDYEGLGMFRKKDMLVLTTQFNF